MAFDKLYNELIAECSMKLGRKLTKKELEFIAWVKERQLEKKYGTLKSS
ncbi:hypothetical protein [Alkalihalobacterium alkalinitrilicum]|nr:hypothetical protein [Alkalihalobacterium alkalinitrilicum]